MQWPAAPATTIVTSVCAAAADPAIAVTDAEAQVEGEHTGTSRKATKEATGTTVRPSDFFDLFVLASRLIKGKETAFWRLSGCTF